MDILQALKNEKSKKNDIRLRLKTNHIEITVLNIRNRKKKDFSRETIDVLKAVSEAVVILDHMQRF